MKKTQEILRYFFNISKMHFLVFFVLFSLLMSYLMICKYSIKVEKQEYTGELINSYYHAQLKDDIDSVEFITYKKLKERDTYTKYCKTCHGNMNDNNTKCTFYEYDIYKTGKSVMYVNESNFNKLKKSLEENSIDWLLFYYIKKFE